MGRESESANRSELMPARKPFEQHKIAMSITLEPARRKWLRENYAELGYRSESHAVDDAIGLLMQKAEPGRSHPPSSSTKSSRSRTQ